MKHKGVVFNESNFNFTLTQVWKLVTAWDSNDNMFISQRCYCCVEHKRKRLSIQVLAESQTVTLLWSLPLSHIMQMIDTQSYCVFKYLVSKVLNRKMMVSV